MSSFFYLGVVKEKKALSLSSVVSQFGQHQPQRPSRSCLYSITLQITDSISFIRKVAYRPLSRPSYGRPLSSCFVQPVPRTKQTPGIQSNPIPRKAGSPAQRQRQPRVCDANSENGHCEEGLGSTWVSSTVSWPSCPVLSGHADWIGGCVSGW